MSSNNDIKHSAVILSVRDWTNNLRDLSFVNRDRILLILRFSSINK